MDTNDIQSQLPWRPQPPFPFTHVEFNPQPPIRDYLQVGSRVSTSHFRTLNWITTYQGPVDPLLRPSLAYLQKQTCTLRESTKDYPVPIHKPKVRNQQVRGLSRFISSLFTFVQNMAACQRLELPQQVRSVRSREALCPNIEDYD